MAAPRMKHCFFAVFVTLVTLLSFTGHAVARRTESLDGGAVDEFFFDGRRQLQGNGGGNAGNGGGGGNGGRGGNTNNGGNAGNGGGGGNGGNGGNTNNGGGNAGSGGGGGNGGNGGNTNHGGGNAGNGGGGGNGGNGGNTGNCGVLNGFVYGGNNHPNCFQYQGGGYIMGSLYMPAPGFNFYGQTASNYMSVNLNGSPGQMMGSATSNGVQYIQYQFKSPYVSGQTIPLSGYLNAGGKKTCFSAPVKVC